MKKIIVVLLILLLAPICALADVNWFIKRFPDFDACEGCVEDCKKVDRERWCRVDMDINSYTDEEYKSLIQEIINKDGRGFDFRIREVVTMLYRYIYEHPEDKRFNDLKKYIYDKEVLIGLWKQEEIIQYIPSSLPYYREVIKYILLVAGSNLQYLTSEQRDDEEFVLAAISENKEGPITQYQGNNIEYASDRIKNKKAVAIIAIQNSMQGYAINYISKELQQDLDVKKAFKTSNDQFLKSIKRK